MRDGTRLSADVFLPDAEAPAPAVLLRTPYDNTQPGGVAWARRFTARGYAFVIQDVRGRGDSDGVFTPWLDDFDDGYDTVEWVAAQPWCNGRVGMLGGSYLAWVQWAAATRRPPHLTALVAAGSPGRWGRDWPYRHGAFMAEDYLEWLYRVGGRSYQPSDTPDWTPVHASRKPRQLDALLGRALPHWQACLDHPTLDEYWTRLEIGGYEHFDLPTLHITGWFDMCAPGTLHHYHAMVAHSPAAAAQCLLIGPWNHGGACATGQPVPGAHELSADAALDLSAVWLAWFDRWLLGRADAPQPQPVRYYALGAAAWRAADAWPPSDARPLVWQLGADGALTTAPAQLGERSYRYDPDDPTPFLPTLDAGPPPDPQALDVRFLAARPDTLVYISAPQASACELAGPVMATLWVASDGPDTDFAVVLADVAPDGRAALLSHGILRAAFRDSLSQPTPLTPHAPTRLEVELHDLGHVLLPGHRLQAIVCSALFPYYHPNPNSGALPRDEDARRVATQTIFHGAQRASTLTLLTRSGAG